jgi:nuclear transport factor 2 (NTF2) superfamily protein
VRSSFREARDRRIPDGEVGRELDYRLIKELWVVTDNHESTDRWHGKAVGFKAW